MARRVDYLDRSLKIIVEVDSILHHTSPADMARDRARDRALLAEGWLIVLRVAEEDIWYRPWHVVEQVRRARSQAKLLLLGAGATA